MENFSEYVPGWYEGSSDARDDWLKHYIHLSVAELLNSFDPARRFEELLETGDYSAEECVAILREEYDAFGKRIIDAILSCSH